MGCLIFSVCEGLSTITVLSPVEVFLAALAGCASDSRGVALPFDTERRVLPFSETPLLAHDALLSLEG